MTKDFQPISAVLSKILEELNLSAWVGSPGSRNAPLMEALSSLGCPYAVILDERSAGYFALGVSIKSQMPVALVSTSGTAALNYTPAVAEAFYQRIPLLVITADRPKELIDNGHGQSVRQEKIYEGHIRASALLDPEISIQENVDRVTQALYHLKNGPVHINVPIKEPLYGKPIFNENISIKLDKILEPGSNDNFFFPDWLGAAKYPLLIIGQWNPLWGEINHLVEKIKSKGWLVTGEHLSQLSSTAVINLDNGWRSLDDIVLDAVVTIGGAWVSKKSKFRLKGVRHMHIGPSSPHPDMFGNLKYVLESSYKDGLESLIKHTPVIDKTWTNKWVSKNVSKTEKWSDLWVHEAISNFGLNNWDIHWANSSSVRYGIHTWAAGGWANNEKHYSNRGTSGIDGCTSTAVGSAWISNKRTILITGDLAFFYDSNAFLNREVPEGFKVVVINNRGGDIFRRLPMAGDSELYDTHYLWKHNHSVKKLVSYAGLEYFYAASIDDWENVWLDFIESRKSSVLEVFTDSNINDRMWNDRFQQ